MDDMRLGGVDISVDVGLDWAMWVIGFTNAFSMPGRRGIILYVGPIYLFVVFARPGEDAAAEPSTGGAKVYNMPQAEPEEDESGQCNATLSLSDDRRRLTVQEWVLYEQAIDSSLFVPVGVSDDEGIAEAFLAGRDISKAKHFLPVLALERKRGEE